ncbi:MAG: hypothetical protein V4550_08945 [Gemmatimonadota bacterium]
MVSQEAVSAEFKNGVGIHAADAVSGDAGLVQMEMQRDTTDADRAKAATKAIQSEAG